MPRLISRRDAWRDNQTSLTYHFWYVKRLNIMEHAISIIFNFFLYYKRINYLIIQVFHFNIKEFYYSSIIINKVNSI
jgi:hypothetical protein